MSHFTASLTIILYMVGTPTRVTGSFHTSGCDINTGITAAAPRPPLPPPSLHPCGSQSFITSLGLIQFSSSASAAASRGHMISSAAAPETAGEAGRAGILQSGAFRKVGPDGRP